MKHKQRLLNNRQLTNTLTKLHEEYDATNDWNVKVHIHKQIHILNDIIYVRGYKVCTHHNSCYNVLSKREIKEGCQWCQPCAYEHGDDYTIKKLIDF